MKRFNLIVIMLLMVLVSAAIFSCNRRSKTSHAGHEEKVQYTCPMHPEIIRDAPGSCPICGMDLVRKETEAAIVEDVTLTTVLQPTNEYVISTVPVARAEYRNEPMEIDALGYTAYNTSATRALSSRVSGRIERLYIKYRYQLIKKGERVMDIYSPELLTAQENLLFVLKNDPDNKSLISAAWQKLHLLGMSEQQIGQIVNRRKALLYITVFSNYSGHIHEATGTDDMAVTSETPMDLSSQPVTKELSIKEGMYVQNGQTLFKIYNPDKLWGLLSIQQADQPFVKKGDKVRIVPEARPHEDFRATVSYVEPVFRQGSRNVVVRVNIDGNGRIPVGSQLRGTIFTEPHPGWWVPKEAVLSLGINSIVFLKQPGGFAAHKVTLGHTHPEWVQVQSGLGENDSVALNAQFLMDSERFIKINNK